MMMSKMLKKTWVVCLLASVSCLLWGSAFPGIKIGYTLFHIGSLDAATQILFAGCRFFLAGSMVILFGSLVSGRFLVPKTISEWKHASVISFLEMFFDEIFLGSTQFLRQTRKVLFLLFRALHQSIIHKPERTMS